MRPTDRPTGTDDGDTTDASMCTYTPAWPPRMHTVPRPPLTHTLVMYFARVFVDVRSGRFASYVHAGGDGDGGGGGYAVQ